MANGISGNLKDLKLVELLILLCSKKEQIGRLHFTSNKEHGEIFINNGKIIHATTEVSSGKDAIYTLLTWKEGTFEFETDANPGKITITADTKEFLADCIKKRKELNVIEELIAHPDEIFKLSGRSTSGRVSLSTEDLHIISYLDGTKTLREIEKISGKNRYEIFKTLYRLLSFEVVVNVDHKSTSSQEPLMTDALLNRIEKRLKTLSGPLTELILQNSINKLGYQKSTLPVSKLDDLIDSFAREAGVDKDKVKQLIKSETENTSDSVSTDEPVVNENMMDVITKRLSITSGPITPIIMEKCIKNLGYRKDKFPVSKLNSLMDSFIKEIGIKETAIKDILEDIQKFQQNEFLYKDFPTGDLSTRDQKEKKGFFARFGF
ncbi:MAG: DUF4388 domain-containing protein [Candidatus Eremiobacterota bacterium]|mgnify:FL=1